MHERALSPERPGALFPFTAHDRDALFLEFQPLVDRLVGWSGGDPETRQDLSGEIYFRFCALLDLYDPARGVPLRAYLARRLSASVFTYARRRRRNREGGLNALGLGGEQGADPSMGPGWDERLDSEWVARFLPAAVGSLTDRQASVLVWRYYEGWSYERIAAALEGHPAAVRSLLRHALSGLRLWFARNEVSGVRSINSLSAQNRREKYAAARQHKQTDQ